MIKTELPGLKAAHQMITPKCRQGRGADGAFEEAIARMKHTYTNYVSAEGNADVTWHIVLVRDDTPEPDPF